MFDCSASVPVALRKVGTDQNTHYRLIGQNSMCDMNYGEPLKKYENDTEAEIAEKAEESSSR
jgi:hypothetical protein